MGRRSLERAAYSSGHARSWSATLMRSRSQLLGVVYAPDESAEAAAISEFKIG